MLYIVTQCPIQSLLTYIHDDDIAIPEIQRPFVWDATKVRNLLDSLYKGFPVGYLIAWRNPDVKLKDGSLALGKRILIDGQQRVTALMAALLGQEIVTKDYECVRICIAFHPVKEEFQVLNSAIGKDKGWISDVAALFSPNTDLYSLVTDYCEQNSGIKPGDIHPVLEKLRNIATSQIGLIELDKNLDIDTVTEIFIRVNSAGTELSQADFAMSKIATNETFGGNTLRKAIDYFCHLTVTPDFHKTIQKNDPKFAATEYFQKMSWLKDEKGDIYDPSYTDMLRVAFTSEFHRGRLKDLVALLSGRNFETKQFEEAIAESSFEDLRKGILNFINESNFKRFLMIVRSAGFIDASLIGSQNALNFSYIIYLTLKAQGKPATEIESAVRRWVVFSMLTRRYSGSPESTFDQDIRQIHDQGFDNYANEVIRGQLSDAFWGVALPQEMDTSSLSGPYFKVFRAAQVKMNDSGFLSRDIKVKDLIEIKSDVHHIYPANYLKKQGLSRGKYNQIANFAITQSEINIAISDKDPSTYFEQLLQQCGGKVKKYGGITDLEEMKANLRSHCIPEKMLFGDIPEYDDFLIMRRKLMAQKMKTYFERL